LGTGNSYVYIRDPEGNLLELEGTPWAPEEARRPWFAHVALVTPDISRLTDFYALLTGIDIHRQGSFGPSPKFDHVAGLSDICFTGAWSRLANAELEFWCYAHPPTLPRDRRNLAAPGWNHICFESDNIEADYARLMAHGVELHGPPHAFGNAWLFFGRDPDGNVFEVLQPGTDKQLTVAAMLQEANGHKVDAARTAYRDGLAATVTEA
jgi:catechol 2,3-dioxygenase-like lactoylglutathione lyase family enzyme